MEMISEWYEVQYCHDAKDPDWFSMSPTYDSLERAKRAIVYARRETPQFAFRLVKRSMSEEEIS